MRQLSTKKVRNATPDFEATLKESVCNQSYVK